MIHVSLDLETWGKRAGFDLRSIGACVFDPVQGTVGGYDHLINIPEHLRHMRGLDPDTFYIATDNPMIGYRKDVPKYPLKRDPSTVQWWSEQSAEAQAAFANPVDLRDALLRLSEWLSDVTYDERLIDETGLVEPLNWPGLRLWTHGPGFDPPILEAAYHAVGLPVPWNYRAPRDTRTLFDAAGIDDDGDGSYRTFMTQYNTGTAHNALDDAIAQARCICAAQAIITDWRFAAETYRPLLDDHK